MCATLPYQVYLVEVGKCLVDYSQWLQGSELVNSFYPLRPELIESTYHHYRTTGKLFNPFVL